MEDQTFRIEKNSLFLSGEIIKKEKLLGVSWLLSIAQHDSASQSKKQHAEYFFDEILKETDQAKERKIKVAGKSHSLPVCAVPAELLRKFHRPLFKKRFHEDAIKLLPKKERKRFASPISKREFDNLINDAEMFLSGLQDFVSTIKSDIVETGNINYKNPIFTPEERYLTCDADKRIVYSYGSKNLEEIAPMKELGPLLLSDLMISLSILAFEDCAEPSCKKLFFNTHATQKFCTYKCSVASGEAHKKKLFESTEEVADFDRYRQLISRKSYLRKTNPGISDSKIAAIWRKENFENVEYWIKRLITHPKRKKSSSEKK